MGVPTAIGKGPTLRVLVLFRSDFSLLAVDRARLDSGCPSPATNRFVGVKPSDTTGDHALDTTWAGSASLRHCPRP